MASYQDDQDDNDTDDEQTSKFDKLKQYLSQGLSNLGSNLDQSNQMIGQQTQLAEKRLQNPNYQPTPEEQANQDKYYQNVTGAVAGTLGSGVAPTQAAGPGGMQKLKQLLTLTGRTPEQIEQLSAKELQNATQQIMDEVAKRNAAGQVTANPITRSMYGSAQQAAERQAGQDVRAQVQSEQRLQDALDFERKQAALRRMQGQ